MNNVEKMEWEREREKKWAVLWNGEAVWETKSPLLAFTGKPVAVVARSSAVTPVSLSKHTRIERTEFQ